MIDVDRADIESLSDGDGVTVLVTESLDRLDFVRYAGASGDFNPLHVDEVRAREAGYDSVFAHGMLLCGYASQVVAGWLGIERLASVRTRFVSKAKPGDPVSVRCEVVERGPQTDGTGDKIQVLVEVTGSDGRLFAEGEATAVVRR